MDLSFCSDAVQQRVKRAFIFFQRTGYSKVTDVKENMAVVECVSPYGKLMAFCGENAARYTINGNEFALTD